MLLVLFVCFLGEGRILTVSRPILILSYPLFFFLFLESNPTNPTSQLHHEPTHAVYRLVVSSLYTITSTTDSPFFLF